MNKIITIFLILIMPAIAFAETPQISPLNKNDRAPFSGVLYNPIAVAELVAQREALIKQHQAFMELLEKQLQAKCDLEVDNLSAEVDICNDRYGHMVGIKDTQIKQLQDLALERPKSHSQWWFAGGITTGILITIGVAYAIK
mgnify:CR=1 FL=1